MTQGDICLLDTDVPHSVGYLGEEDIIITIEMQKEYLTQGFLQRPGPGRLHGAAVLRDPPPVPQPELFG